jgi:hypothetical protein
VIAKVAFKRTLKGEPTIGAAFIELSSIPSPCTLYEIHLNVLIFELPSIHTVLSLCM